MAAKSKVDLSRFYTALQAVMDVPKKSGPDVLNKSVLQVTVGSGGGKGLVHHTRKATEKRIREDLSQMVTAVGKRGGSHSAPRVVLLATNYLVKRGVRPMGWGHDEQIRWRAEVSQACEAIIKARVQSRAYIAAGWLWAAMDLASKVPGHTLTRLAKGKGLPLKGNGEASKSFSRHATEGNLFAGVYNTSNGAGIVVTTGTIQLAVNGETNNLRAYFIGRFSEDIAKATKKSPKIRAPKLALG